MIVYKAEVFLIAASLSVLIIFGCASVGKFTPQGAAVASGALDVAHWIIKAADAGLYASALSLKDHSLITGNEDVLRTSVRVLSGLDSAVGLAKQVIAGATVSDKELNVAAGQVDGAKAILAGK
jgi:hypothetical protein